MKDKEFNLLEEPWIVVLRLDGKEEKVSILSLFRRAHQFSNLAGELPAQDIAILRLLLAILHVVFARFDLHGKETLISSPSEALKRWKEVRDNDEFPVQVIENYLNEYKERFYLFHPEWPFYQLAGIGNSTDYEAAKLNGELSESSNKLRLFPQRSGEGKTSLTYAEAARWLLYINAFDDTSAKPKEKGRPSPGVGWLGKLGLVYVLGGNLFETLMLNLVLLQDGENKLWGEEHPTWELEKAIAEERKEITIPDNLAQLMTLQSRRILLKRENYGDGKEPYVVGYSLLGGDFFTKENSFAEQMTVWRYGKNQDSKIDQYMPRRHDVSKQLWRDFPSLVLQAEGKRRPGIVSWLARLKYEGLLQEQKFCLRTTGVKYGDKDFFVEDTFSDSISMNTGLLGNSGEVWVGRIISELAITNQHVQQVGELAIRISKASGGYNDDVKNIAKEQAYFRLNSKFQVWLENIDPENDELDETCELWFEQSQKVVRGLGRELVEQAGPQAFVGREIKEKIEGKEVERRYTLPAAYNYFLARTANRESIGGGKNYE